MRAELPEARPLVRNGTARHASLLFGGQSKHYDYTMADMELLAERLIALTRQLPWLTMDAVRFPPQPEAEFDRLVEIVEASGAPVEFVRFAERGLAVEQSRLQSDLVLVTADSMSMLAESIASAGRPAFSSPTATSRRSAMRSNIMAMIADRRAFPVSFSGLTAKRFIPVSVGLKSCPARSSRRSTRSSCATGSEIR